MGTNHYEHLLDLSARLLATLEETEIEQAAVSLLPQAFGACCCALLRLGAEREQGRIAALFPEKKVQGRDLSREECLGLLSRLQRKKSQVVEREDAELGSLLRRFRARSALLIVLPTEEEVPPFLMLGFSEPSVPLDQPALALWERAARQVAAALHGAGLYRQTDRRLRELRLLHEVAMITSTTLNVDRMLQQVVETLHHHFSPDACNFFMVNQERGILQAHTSSQGPAGSPEEWTVPLDKGVCGWVFQTGQPLHLPDIRTYPRRIEGSTPGMQCEIAVPIQVRGKIVAVLNLESRRPNAFKGEDLRLLSTVASQLAVAIERAQVFQQSQQRVRELTALMRIGTAIQQATRLEEILDTILDEAFTLAGREHASVLLLDPQRERLYIAASRGLADDLVARLNQEGIPTTFGTFDFVLRTGRTIEVPDTSSDPRVETGYGPLPPQLLNIPLRTEKGVLGILVLDTVPSDNTARRLLQSLASMAAVAIERARLFEETRRRLEEVRFLQEVALAATSTLKFDEVLRRSAEALQRWLEFEVFGFLVVDEASGMLRLNPEVFIGVPEELYGFEIPIGEGITGWVAQTGRPYLTHDVHSDPHYFDAISEIRSEMCVPVKVGDRVIAVIDVESTRPNAFGPNDLRLLTSMAHQLAVALQNAQLFEREQNQYRLAEAMRQAALIVGTTRDLEDLTTQSLGYLENLVPYQAAFLVLLRGQVVEQVRWRGEYAPPSPQEWLAPDTLGNRVLKARRALVLSDVSKELTWKAWPGMEDLRSWIGVPLYFKEEAAGLLLIGARQPYSYGREEASLAFSFASQLSVGIERARAYAEERRRAEQLDLLNRIGQQVVGIMDLPRLLEETVRCLDEAIHPYRTLLAMREDGESLSIQATAGQVEEIPRHEPIPLEEKAPIGWVARNGVPLLLADLTAEERFQAMPYQAGARSEMAVPLWVKNEVIGVLDVQAAQPGRFAESDLATLQAIGSQVAGAIERAMLYTEVKGSLKQLQETDQLRRDVLSTINHEMRAPLTALLGFTDFLLREQAGPLTQAQREYLGDIRTAGERILTLVENILDAAKVEEGRIVPHCTEVSLKQVLERARAMVQPMAMDQALLLETTLADGLPPVWADPFLVERILINLLQNAVKFTPPGGKVWVEVRVAEGEDALEVSVCDTGIGIAPDHFEEIFQRYRRLETPAVGPVSGTGLGLYIVKGLVEAHGGRIWVRSAPGQGSAFTFTLPLTPPQGGKGNGGLDIVVW